MGLWGRTKMLEQYCCESLRNMCVETIDNYNPPVLRLKTDKTEYPDNPYKDFLGEYRFMWMRTVYDWGSGNRCKRQTWHEDGLIKIPIHWLYIFFKSIWRKY